MPEPTNIDQRRQTNGRPTNPKTKVVTPLDERISEMNALALAEAQAASVVRIGNLETKVTALANGLANANRLVQAQAVTIAAAHSIASKALEAAEREE